MLETFKFWCFKVLPLVYDDSLSDYINKLIEQDKVFGDELDKLKQEMNTVKKMD